MTEPLRIGTRDSVLALWQANWAAEVLGKAGFRTEIVAVKSQGDLQLDKPLYQFGQVGIFTRILDEALRENRVDIAVHSLKDVPTEKVEGVELRAVLEREDARDCVVCRDGFDFLQRDGKDMHIATGSLRRAAQWRHRYPGIRIDDLRGNIQTRIGKIKNGSFDGGTFAYAALKRLNETPEDEIRLLDWMLPAPAQGVVGIACRDDDKGVQRLLDDINHTESWESSSCERRFLRLMDGGCTAPIAAFASIKAELIQLETAVFSVDGTEVVRVERTGKVGEAMTIAESAADEAKSKGADRIIREIRESLA